MDDLFLDKLASRVADLLNDTSDEVIAVICRRINELETIGATEAHLLASLSEQADLDEITKAIAKGTALAEVEVKAMYEALAVNNDNWAEAYYKAAGKSYTGWQSSQMASAIVEQGYREAAAGILNLSKTTAFSYGGYVRTIQATYLDTINRATATISTGLGDYRSVMSKAIKNLTNSGLRSVNYQAGSHAEALAQRGILSVKYPSGHTLRLDSAVRMNVMDGMRSTVNTMRDMQGSEFGADGVEISAHALCAPDHQPIQGQQYTNEEWKNISAGLARQIGTLNCKHIIFPVIIGISMSTYTQDQLASFNDNSNELISWTGLSGDKLTATRYEATQYQRQLETMLRTRKSEVRALSEAGFDDVAKLGATYTRSLQKQYNLISRQMGLEPRTWRAR